ncbi:50S ribosomal protein L3 [Patescibacteria group bacterium]|nr:50S ribosomal protein L3 [Patescibacteria group bacterium]MBU1705854.1 50S ribosomal protein L3 [Patescibacteria group bacterium]
MPFIIGRKIEMTQVFQEDGRVVPVTLVKVEPNVVTQVRHYEPQGFVGVQLGTDITKKTMPQAQIGHLKDLAACRTLREFRVDSTELERGQTIDVMIFEPGMQVDVVGTSKGRGFAGVVKRHGFHGSPASHGHKDQLRMPGSLGSRMQAPVAKGKRMGGHMGDARVTVKNLKIAAVNPEQHVIAIKGAVPGARGSLVTIVSREGKKIWQM